MKRWPKLKPGDVVDVVAPGWKCSPKDLKLALEELKSWQLTPRVPKNIFAKESLFSNSDQERFMQLKRALLAKDSQAVWCLRGGYGSIRLIPYLAKLKKPSFCKAFLGLSDITSLHLFLNQYWNWSTIHGPLLERHGFHPDLHCLPTRRSTVLR